MKRLLLLLMAALLLCCCGCMGGEKDAGHKPSQGAVDKPAVPVAEAVTARLYYPREDGMKLVAVAAELPKSGKYRAAVERLAAGTDKPGLTGIFPPGVQVRKVNVANGTATVDFSAELRKNFQGGSTGEEMLIGSLVNTLTEIREIKRVSILVEGKRVASIGGHMDASEPFTRMTELISVRD